MTIKLIDDCVVTQRIEIRKPKTENEPADTTAYYFIIDLNGHTVEYSGTEQGLFLVSNGKLIIQDTAKDAGRVELGACYIASMNQKGNVNITGGIYTTSYSKLFAGNPSNGTITGGTFSVNPSTYVPQNYAAVTSEQEGYWDVGNYKATITEEDGTVSGYDMYNDAVTSAGNKDKITITLTANAKRKGATTVPIEKTWTIDLNGYNLTNSAESSDAAAKTFSVSGNLIIKDSKGCGSVIASKSYTGYGSAVYVNSAATFRLISGTIDGSTAQSAKSAIHLYSATTSNNQNARISISGGSVKGKITRNSTKGTGGIGTIAITGGTFDNDPSNYVLADYKAVEESESGPWNVQPRSYVASVTLDAVTTKYEEFGEAFDAANSTDKVAVLQLLADCKTTKVKTIVNGADLTIDLNGKNISTTSESARIFTVNGKLSICDTSAKKDGKILGNGCSASGNVIFVKAGGTVNISDGIIQAGSGAGDTAAIYVTYTTEAYGTLNISGGTIIGGVSRKAASEDNPDLVGSISVSGGWFSEISAGYCQEGCARVKVVGEDYAVAPYHVSKDVKSIPVTYNYNNEDVTKYCDAEDANNKYNRYKETLPDCATVTYLDGYVCATPLTTDTPTGRENVFSSWNTEAGGNGTTIPAGTTIYANVDTASQTDTVYYLDSNDNIQVIGTISTLASLNLYAQWVVGDTKVCTAVKDGPEPKGFYSVKEALLEFSDETEQIAITLNRTKDNEAIEVNEAIEILATQKVILDLNGSILKNLNTGSAITNNGSLTICDTAGSGYIEGNAQSKGGGVDNYGTLKLESGTIKGSAAEGSGVYNRKNGEFTMTGGKVEYTNSDVSTEAIYSNGGTITIYDGEVVGSIGGSVINVVGGRFSSNPATYLAYGYKATGDDNIGYTVAFDPAGSAVSRVDETTTITMVDPDAENKYNGYQSTISKKELDEIVGENKTVNIITGMGATSKVGGTAAQQTTITNDDGSTWLEAKATGASLRYNKKVTQTDEKYTANGKFDVTKDKTTASDYMDLRLSYEFTLPAGVDITADTTSWGWTVKYGDNEAEIVGKNYKTLNADKREYQSNIVFANIPLNKYGTTNFQAVMWIKFQVDGVTYKIRQSEATPMGREVDDLIKGYAGMDNLADDAKAYVDAIYEIRFPDPGSTDE